MTRAARVNENWVNGVMGTQKESRPPYEIDVRRKVEIARDLFITGSHGARQDTLRQDGVVSFSQEEIQTAVGSVKENRAASPDGIPPEAIKEVTKNQNEWILGV
ncbi:hypothetical protein ILUMI_03405 [Ignelater luminosus]|uniref:Uncharacterized protein n=1 Tax=Ignelater luminosus TaxID=2038154 RepID=A0A8K0DFV2_IGNLU|nr:hypothetical protein ILUMI_03405 [Ignelater luminosus]